ncbi:MAG: tRNA uridine-5-carboxymethylaminomethyl(34) synthesis GTPase MnmE [Gallionellaceae bacterium]|nr:MAG: tRNA uridine-5-carboxymethylaminomethyl(34) synthesis GTPase MnmE [Gallionellaceae bacterium]
MQQKPDTIAAIATAPGRGGIGVVRISGRNVETVSVALLGQALLPRHATYVPFLDVDGSIIDQGIAIFFPGPNSYTGEDVLELQGHGGIAALHLLLQRCLASGARPAQPGEFTQRAYLNNKLDLVQAESVADLIDASSAQAVRSANRSLQGDFSKAIHKLVDGLIDLRMLVEALLDFPEEELDSVDFERGKNKLESLRAELARVMVLAQQGNILREGAHIVLVGQPNVGKSSLLNRLSGEDLALVSEIAGTTRDTIRQAINIHGVPLHIIDTAGLRESQDVVEQMGMERTKQAIQKADAVLLLMDAQQEDKAAHQKILELIPDNIPRLYVVNKIDLLQQEAHLETRGGDSYIYLSAKTEEGIDLLRDKILQLIDWHAEAGAFMARERHLRALAQAKQSLQRAAAESAQAELFAEELRLAQVSLSEITGEFSSDDLLGEIFSRFCIGK